MGISARARPRQTRWGAFLTLLALGTLAHGRAEADCVHRSHAQGEPDGPSRFARLFEAGGLPTAPLPKAPCSGATCSGRTSTPLLPAPPAPPGVERWGLLAIEGRAPAPALEIPRAADSVALPSHRGPSIFHPPRPATPPRNA